MHLDLPDEEWPQWTVGRLRDEIKTLTSIPPENQRLIHRGKSIFGSDSTLESLRLKSGDRLMVLNSNQKPTDDPKLQQLRQIDTSRVKHLDRKIDDLKTQLDGIDKVHSIKPFAFLVFFLSVCKLLHEHFKTIFFNDYVRLIFELTGQILNSIIMIFERNY